MKNNMASKIINFCFAARQIGLKKISNSQSLVQCTKCLNTRLLFSPLYSSTSKFSSTVNRYTEQSLTNNTNNELQKPDELDILYKNILLELKCHDTGVIRSYQKFTEMAAKELDIEISKIYTPKRDITRFAVLKSVHVFKKHKVQYETRTHYKVIEFKHITESTADTFLEYLQRNLPEGVAMKITKTRLERMPEHILQEQLQRESEIRKDHMVLEDVSGTYQENHENEDLTPSLDSAQSESEQNEIDFKSENSLETASESTIETASESAVDAKNDKDNSDSSSSSSSDSDSDSDSDSESKDKEGETVDPPNDKTS